MARRSGRNPDPIRVVAAQLAGTAERCIVGRALTEDLALVEFGERLATLPPREKQQALNYAAARYLDVGTDPAQAIVLLLARAGADLDRARAIQRERGHSFLVR